MSKKGASDRTALTVAAVAAVAAITAGAIGAVGGGLAAYWGNKSLQKSSSAAAARGIARVYQGEFVDLDARLSAMLDTGLLIPPNHAGFEMTTDDKKQLAAVMSGKDWYTVQVSESALRTFEASFEDPSTKDFKESVAGLSVKLTPSLKSYVRNNLTAAEHAIVALADAAGQPPSEPLGG